MEESRNAVVLTCLLIYFALCIGVGVWALRRTKSSHDFFMAGREPRHHRDRVRPVLQHALRVRLRGRPRPGLQPGHDVRVDDRLRHGGELLHLLPGGEAAPHLLGGVPDGFAAGHGGAPLPERNEPVPDGGCDHPRGRRLPGRAGHGDGGRAAGDPEQRRRHAARQPGRLDGDLGRRARLLLRDRRHHRRRLHGRRAGRGDGDRGRAGGGRGRQRGRWRPRRRRDDAGERRPGGDRTVGHPRHHGGTVVLLPVRRRRLRATPHRHQADDEQADSPVQADLPGQRDRRRARGAALDRDRLRHAGAGRGRRPSRTRPARRRGLRVPSSRTRTRSWRASSSPRSSRRSCRPRTAS